MTDLKACYKCKKTDDVEKTTNQITVKYKGKVVMYQHEGHYCKACNRHYDEAPGQTEANQKRLHDAWLELKNEFENKNSEVMGSDV